jgi:hypothetical protein
MRYLDDMQEFAMAELVDSEDDLANLGEVDLFVDDDAGIDGEGVDD